MLRAVVLLGFVAFVHGATLDGRIVGGEDADIKNYPYIVSVRYKDEHFCGGSIVSRNVILTAAHCIKDFTRGYLTVRVGNTNHKLGKEYDVGAFYQHGRFNKDTTDFDIGVLMLTKDLTFGPTVQPIDIIASKQDLVAGTKASACGWGDEWEGAKKSPDNLKCVELDIIDDTECKNIYRTRLTQNMFCTKTKGKDTCQADSGGPLVQDGKLIGIISWGIGCARSNYAGVFTKLSLFHDWVMRYVD